MVEIIGSNPIDGSQIPNNSAAFLLSMEADNLQLNTGVLKSFGQGLYALDGNDTVKGSEDNEVMNGNRDDDLLMGGFGQDFLRGGKGIDEIHGDEGEDIVFGDRQDDFLYGGEGNDLVRGGKDSDFLEGGPGDDQILGDKGADNLIGGPGLDILTGGNDPNGSGDRVADIFQLATGEGTDIITDFEPGVDFIELPRGVSEDDIQVRMLEQNSAITITATGEELAVLNNITPNSLDDRSFIDLTTETKDHLIAIEGNQTPEVEDDKIITLEEDNIAALNISAPTDPDGDTFTITIDSIPNTEIGKVVLENTTKNSLTIGQQLTTDELTSLTFIPVANANGYAGTFSYIVDDGSDKNNSTTQVISIDVIPVNDPPNAVDDGPVFTSLGNQLIIDVLANDSDIDGPEPLLITTLTNDEGLGFLSNSGTDVEYRSSILFGTGTDIFQYTVTDGSDEATATATVNILSATDNTDSEEVSITSPTSSISVIPAIDKTGNESNDEQDGIIEEPAVNERKNWQGWVYKWEGNRDGPSLVNLNENLDKNKDFELVGIINLGSNIRENVNGRYGINGADWGLGSVKGYSQLPTNNFLVKAYTEVDLKGGKTYEFEARGDDKYQIWLKNLDTEEWSWVTKKDEWKSTVGMEDDTTIKNSYTVPPDKGGRYYVGFFHYENDQEAYFSLNWKEKEDNADSEEGKTTENESSDEKKEDVIISDEKKDVIIIDPPVDKQEELTFELKKTSLWEPGPTGFGFNLDQGFDEKYETEDGKFYIQMKGGLDMHFSAGTADIKLPGVFKFNYDKFSNQFTVLSKIDEGDALFSTQYGAAAGIYLEVSGGLQTGKILGIKDINIELTPISLELKATDLLDSIIPGLSNFLSIDNSFDIEDKKIDQNLLEGEDTVGSSIDLMSWLSFESDNNQKGKDNSDDLSKILTGNISMNINQKSILELIGFRFDKNGDNISDFEVEIGEEKQFTVGLDDLRVQPITKLKTTFTPELSFNIGISPGKIESFEFLNSSIDLKVSYEEENGQYKVEEFNPFSIDWWDLEFE